MIIPYLAIALLLAATVYSAVVSFRSTGDKSNDDRSKDDAPNNDKPRTWAFPDHAGRPARILVGVFTLIFLTGAGVWLIASVRNSARPSSRFLIPDGYTGWVRIDFEVNGTSPLTMDHNEYVVTIPANGKLQTSSPEQYGWASNRYFYSSAQGLRPLADSGPSEFIWGKINGEESGDSGRRKYEEFFVGTEQQFKDQGKDVNKQ
jgi:hypothetical protein